MLIEGFLNEMYKPNAYGTKVYLTPGRLFGEGQKLVVHFLQPQCATGDHHTTEGSRKRKAGRLRRVINGGTATRRPEDEDANLGDYSENDGVEVEAEQDSETALESPAKRRRSNYQPSCIPAPLSDAGTAYDADSGSDPEDSEWKGNLRGAPAATHRT